MTTTTYHDIIYTVANGIATVVLNRPKRGNAITPRMRDELIVAFKQIATDSTVRAAVLTGAGPYFCTGMDLAQTSDMADDAGPAKDPVVSAIQMFDAIRHCSKPVVARIQGPALGGGVGLVFCTDIRVAVATTKSVDKQQNRRSKDVYFRLSEVERGLVPAVIARYIVPDLGPVRARQLMMTALPVTAVEAAREWPGFLTSVVDDIASLDAAIADFTNALRNNAPLAMADAKRLVAALGDGDAAVQGTSSESSDDDKAVGVVKQVFTRMLASEEAAYGIGEFLAKRRPNWDEYIATTQAKSKL